MKCTILLVALFLASPAIAATPDSVYVRPYFQAERNDTATTLCQARVLVKYASGSVRGTFQYDVWNTRVLEANGAVSTGPATWSLGSVLTPAGYDVPPPHLGFYSSSPVTTLLPNFFDRGGAVLLAFGRDSLQVAGLNGEGVATRVYDHTTDAAFRLFSRRGPVEVALGAQTNGRREYRSAFGTYSGRKLTVTAGHVRRSDLGQSATVAEAMMNFGRWQGGVQQGWTASRERSTMVVAGYTFAPLTRATAEVFFPGRAQAQVRLKLQAGLGGWVKFTR